MNLTASIYLLLATLVIAEEIPKRTPIGFSGVRGKKLSYQGEYDLPGGERYYPYTGEETFRDDVEGRTTDDDEEDVVPFVLDRSPQEKRSSYGFVGMRGKKTPLSAWFAFREHYRKDPEVSLKKQKEVEVFQYDQKRAPYAFLGMRGKKEKFSSLYKTKDQYGDKRAPMGFIGMRGKKSYDIINDSSEKTD